MTTTRHARPTDAEVIAAIYNQGIEDRIATFETRLRTPAEVCDWFTDEHVVVVAEEQGRPVAFGVTHPYSPRPCYSGIAEVSVYVGREARGRGMGQAVLEEVIRQAAGRGWWKLIGRVFAENSASRALCRKCGFREVGTHYALARLDGVWVDVVVVERLL
jgi:L-amino acid N-acyltransferase YncA